VYSFLAIPQGVAILKRTRSLLVARTAQAHRVLDPF